ncbi:hypothetical protein GCM10023339_34850 [Alloalcanivorax gelatiniphagus]
MTTEQASLAAAGVVAITALVVALLAHRRARRAATAVGGLVERLALLESPVPDAPRATTDMADIAAVTGPDAGAPASAYVITGLGDVAAAAPAEAPLARPIDGRLFADIVARETVVKAASWTHGIRRALAPETRNRIRFAVRQETRRSGRERRAEMKQALREFRARERAGARHAAGGAVGEDVA